MPAEILNQIAIYIGRPYKYEAAAGLVSKHLLRSRLICRSFNAAASYAFSKLAQKTKARIEAYTTIHLPTKKFDLDHLLRIFSSSITSSMIKTVVYHINSGESEPDTYSLSELFDDPSMMDMSDEEDEWYSGRSEHLIEYNMTLFKAQCKLQQEFAKSLEAEQQQQRLAKLLSALPQLRTVRVHVKNFWTMECMNQGTSEKYDVGYDAYKTGIPALLQALTTSTVTSLELQGLGTFTLGGLFPTQIHRICNLSRALKNIENLNLQFSHKDSVRDDDGGFSDWADRFTSLSRADRVNHLLLFTENLQRLTLSCHDEDDICDIDDGDWVQDVSRDLKWKRLTHLTLQNFTFDSPSIKDLSHSQRDTLHSMTVTGCHQTAQQWLRLMIFLRDDLSLRSASVKIRNGDLKSAASEQLNKIIAEFGVNKQYQDVDVGSYAIKPKAETAATGVEATKSKVKSGDTDAEAAKSKAKTAAGAGNAAR